MERRYQPSHRACEQSRTALEGSTKPALLNLDGDVARPNYYGDFGYYLQLELLRTSLSEYGQS